MIAIGMGGNVGGDDAVVARFRRARAALGAMRSASLYRSAPIGPAQPDFLNTAVLIPDVGSTPDKLIGSVLAVEALLGRDRTSETRWGPRLIDLDVLAWEIDSDVDLDPAFAWWPGRRIATPTLEVPHPRLNERRFALEPLADLIGEPFRGMLRDVIDQRVERVAESW